MVHCNQCGYDWVPRLTGINPVVCTRCKRYDWGEPKKEGRVKHEGSGQVQGSDAGRQVPARGRAQRRSQGAVQRVERKKPKGRVPQEGHQPPPEAGEDFEDAIERQEQESKDWVKGQPGLTAADRIRARMAGSPAQGEVKPHSGHRVYKSGDREYCSDCKEYF